jgi:hypothetical protein
MSRASCAIPTDRPTAPQTPRPHPPSLTRSAHDRAGRSSSPASPPHHSPGRADIADAHDPAWLAALDEGILGVFRDDLHHSLPEDKDRYRAVILLRAVAFAYGRGLPWRDIWPLIAHAVDDNGAYYGDADIAWLLESRLGGYLVTDIEDNTTVYRLFHDLLRTTLRERWRDLLTPPTNP